MVIILCLYLSLVWLLFFKFKVLPWNKLSQWIVILAGTVILTGFLVGLQALTPSSSEAGITARIIDIAPQVSGRVSEVHVHAMKPVAEGEVLFEIDPTLYEAKVFIERWCIEYNTLWLHSSLGYRPPAPEATEPLNSGNLRIQNTLALT